MVKKEKLILKVRALLWKRGQEALRVAKQTILEEKIPFEPLQEALRYFVLGWEDVLHPALLSLACEAIGRKPEATTQFGAALVLLAGGADVHDDIIDQSTVKNAKPTVFGKFGKDLSLLVGDALLFEGLYMLHEASGSLQHTRKQQILDLTKQSFFGISSAEAKETSLRGKTDVAAEYMEMIKMKASVGEATAKIGAVLGGGNAEQVEALGHYGKTLAILYTIRDEYIDIYELDELRNRVEKECLPLPILYALKDSSKSEEILRLLRKKPLTKGELENILDTVIGSNEANELKTEMRFMIDETDKKLRCAKSNRPEFKLLLQSMMEDL